MEYKTTEAQRKASAKYQANNRCKITIDVTPDQREYINEYCSTRGGTATHIKDLLRADMRHNGVEPF